VGLEILGLLAASAGVSYGWWWLQVRREHKLLDLPRDPDLDVVLAVAQHEMTSRGHGYVSPLHLLYGLVQDETFAAAIGRLAGDSSQFESFAQAGLDKHQAHDETAAQEGMLVLGYMFAAAGAQGRAATCTDLWARLVRTDAGKAAAAAAKVDPVALLFLLVHGMPEPEPELPDRTEVHVVLRNDDHTTQEFVTHLLCDVFALPEAEATTRMLETHREGRAIVGRYKIAAARDKVLAARRRARDEGFPLWIGVEDC
jgi:ATP-dependent Clp protease adaptor protein ClpS